jgi:peptidyl-prolyl cis-trans isomerase B (cyclophilin B)
MSIRSLSLFSLFTFIFGVFMMGNAAADDALRVELDTTKGKIVLQLTADKTPITVANFVNLVKRGYYNGITFHRVIDDFMVQGGDPTGTGAGGPGYEFEDEFVSDLQHDGPGILSMANRGPRTNGSQFFITHKETPWLNGKHTVFGKVVEGMDVVNAITQGDSIKAAKVVAGDAEALLAAQKERVDGWNAILDKKS